MNIDEDTCVWLGCPTPLEMYKHQCALLEDELIQYQIMLRKAQGNIAGLVQMNELLATGKAAAESALKAAQANISRQNYENSEMAGKVRSLELVANQRDHLLRENQRLLLELKVFRGPQL